MSSPNTDQSLQLKIRDIKISEKEWPCPEDCLERHVEIENLSPMLLNTEGPLVMGVDSPWGGGKTTFIRLWQHYLSKEGYISLCLNAWESDFTEDPLLSLVAQLDKELFSQDNYSGSKSDWEEAKKIIPGLLRTTILSVGKQLTIGGVNVGKVIDDINKHTEENLGENLIKKHSETQDAMNNFRKLLEKSLSCIPDNQRNLIIFIDELDRCNPIYAVTMLERIKHLFNIEHIVFVLSINSEQLAKSFSGVYGANFDGKGYLKRFIDLDYQLKVSDLSKYIDVIFNNFEIQKISSDRHLRIDVDTTKHILKLLTDSFGYQPRDINQLVARMRLAMLSRAADYDFDPVLVICFLILRSENNRLYAEFVNNPLIANKVIKYLLDVTPETQIFPRGFSVIAERIIGCNKEQNVDSVRNPWRLRVQRESDNDSPISQDLKNMFDTAKKISEDRIGFENMKATYDQVEFVNGFKL